MNSMPQTPHEVNVTDVGGSPYPPQSAPAQAPQGVSNFADGSGTIFSMYLEMATEEDKKMVDNWKADADGILIFTGLFSAAVASLISVSIQDIRQDPRETSNFYLANIYQTLADPTRSNISSSLPSSPPPFSPPNYAIWVNALWFLSLVISLTCALLATLLQQWARRYLKATQSRYAPHKRARIRAFLSEGVEKLLLPWTVETLPTLLHISLFLFFAGLVVFLWNVNLTIFEFVLSWVGVCAVLYGCITVMPIICHDNPYLMPLSLISVPAWHIVTGISFLIFRALRRLTCLHWHTRHRIQNLTERYGKWLVQGMQKTIEETALKSSSEIDTRAFMWTFDCLDEDHELERFYSGLPGYRSSKMVDDPLPCLAEEGKQRLFTALTGLLDRTFSSDLLPEPVKIRRAIICTKAVDPADTPEALGVLNRILSKYQFGDPLVAEIVQIVRGWEFDMYGDATLNTKATFSKIVVTAQQRNDPWFLLASKSLVVPEDVLRGYAAHGDSLSLAVLIHVTRQQFNHFGKRSWPEDHFSTVLLMASESIFNVRDTLPELQHEFCALWNQISRVVQDVDDWWMAFHILGQIRKIYLVLHQSTDSAPTRFSSSTGDRDRILCHPSSYPKCKVSGHHLVSTPHIHDDSSSTIFARAVPHNHDDIPLDPSFLTSRPYSPSLSAHARVWVDESSTDAPPLGNNISFPIPLQSVERTITESRRIPATSPNPVNNPLTQGSIDTAHLFSPKPSPYSPLPVSEASTSPPYPVAVEYIPFSRPPSLDVPLSYPTQVLPPETHPSMLASGVPGASRPCLSSAPDLGAAANEGESSAKPTSRKEMDTLCLTSAIREVIIANPEPPPQFPSPSPPPIIYVATGGLSHRTLDAEHTEDHPPRHSLGQNDVA